MKKIHIRMKDNTMTDGRGEPIKTTLLFQLEHHSTELTVDYTDCGIDSWTKIVDFEAGDGSKYQFRLGNEPTISLMLPSVLMKEGKLKINPYAAYTEESGEIRRYSGFTYALNVGSIIDAFNAEYEEEPDFMRWITDNVQDLMDRLNNFDEGELTVEEYVEALVGFNLDDYYTKQVIDSLIGNIYNKQEVDNKFDGLLTINNVAQMLSDYYNKTEANDRYYTKTQSNDRYYTKAQADAKYVLGSNIVIIASSTQPARQSGKTIIWVDTSS